MPSRSYWLRLLTADCPDTGTSRRFKREKHEALEQMRQGDRDAWASAEHRLGDRYRELPERDG
jgi:hypothetical protein